MTMARTRTIKPEFWSDEKLATLSLQARLTYIGLWTLSDDYGVVKGHPAWLRNSIFPYDDIPLAQFESWLLELEGIGRIAPFAADGEKFYFIRNFNRHQIINRPSQTRNPSPPETLTEYSVSPHGAGSEPSVSTHGALTDEIETERERERERETTTAASRIADSPLEQIRTRQEPGADHGQEEKAQKPQTEQAQDDHEPETHQVPDVNQPREQEGLSPPASDDPPAPNRNAGRHQPKPVARVTSPARKQIDFDYETGRFRHVLSELVAKWQEAYPAVDVLSELHRMEAWAAANPVHRKSNWQRFIVNWLTKSQDRARSSGSGKDPPGTEGSVERWIKAPSENS